jgi:hypothetical protein
MTRGRRFALLISAVGLLVTGATQRNHFSAIERTSTGWQPFCAQFRVSEHGGAAIRWGRYCRASDGSDRKDTFAPDAAHAGIAIRNIRQNAYYRYKEGLGWTRQPMRLPPQGWSPPPPRNASNGAKAHIQGFHGYKLTNAAGDYVFEAQELNYFKLLRYAQRWERFEEYTDVVLGEPPEGTFAPPVDVPVKELTEPGGIVSLINAS